MAITNAKQASIAAILAEYYCNVCTIDLESVALSPMFVLNIWSFEIRYIEYATE
jgi:hypothetical protein